MKPVLLLILIVTASRAEPHLPPGTKALPSTAPNGGGPLALVNLNHHVLGHARVFGGKQPDLFVAGYGGPQAVHLFRWVDTAENGAPVFAQPVVVKCAFKDKGSVFQDGTVIQPGGAHETGAVGTMLVGSGPNLLICNEAGEEAEDSAVSLLHKVGKTRFRALEFGLHGCAQLGDAFSV